MQAKLIPAILSLAACVPPPNPDPIDDVVDLEAVSTDGSRNADHFDPPPSALAIDPPQASMSPTSLFQMSLAAGSPVSELIGQTAAPRDVIEQRIVTIRDEQIDIAIELTPPTGDFARTIASDTPLPGVQTAINVTCVFNGQPVLGNGGMCKRTAPEPRETQATGPIDASRWQLAVVEELTRTPVSSCTVDTNRIACTLPARAGAAYRIVASANGFSNLWDNTAGLGEHSLADRTFTGAVLSKKDVQCFDGTDDGSTVRCLTALLFTRYVALDRAALAFDPIELKITANGIQSTWESPALLWESGDADAPGPNF